MGNFTTQCRVICKKGSLELCLHSKVQGIKSIASCTHPFHFYRRFPTACRPLPMCSMWTSLPCYSGNVFFFTQLN
uniref:Uncharacterized protein n=1 Tax=Eptatretus burgeri TaxID=7764 RepID=A0A8C4NNM9_EPTBU